MRNKRIKLLLPFIGVIVTIFGCLNNDTPNVLVEVTDLKNKIDTVLINIVHPKQNDLRHQIVAFNTEGKDTFDLAREMVTLKKIDFLLNNTHDQLSESLQHYETHKISEKELYQQLISYQSDFDSLIVSYNLDY